MASDLATAQSCRLKRRRCFELSGFNLRCQFCPKFQQTADGFWRANGYDHTSGGANEIPQITQIIMRDETGYREGESVPEGSRRSEEVIKNQNTQTIEDPKSQDACYQSRGRSLRFVLAWFGEASDCQLDQCIGN